MSDATPAEAIRAVSAAFRQTLAGRYEGLYVYGSLAEGRYRPAVSDVNLLAVVAPGTTLPEVRAAFRPVWRQFGPLLRRAPMVATRPTLARHLRLHPLLAHHLTQHGKRVTGVDLAFSPPIIEAQETAAYQATEALELSAALAPSLLEAGEMEQLVERLRRLARQLGGGGLAEKSSVPQVVAYVQAQVQPAVSRVSAGGWEGGRLPDAPALLPELQAIYESADRVVLVLPHFGPAEVTGVDWTAVTHALGGEYRGLLVTTAASLRLVAQWGRPLAFFLKQYSHAWGHDLLAGLIVPNGQLFRDAASWPSTILVSEMPNAYLTAAGDSFE
ncbi:MAG: nucleotidyltransferase domain-containing protein, partial [Chloroflexota bacterium]